MGTCERAEHAIVMLVLGLLHHTQPHALSV